MTIYKQTILYYIYYITIKEITMIKDEDIIARQNEDTCKFLVKICKVLGVFLIGVIIVDAIFF